MIKMDVTYAVEQLEEKIRQYVHQSQTNGVIVGLSGGIDSAVVYRLCLRALVPHSALVYSAYLPDRFSTEENKKLVEKIAKHPFTMNHFEKNIEPISEAFMDDDLIGYEGNKVTQGNLRSRIRMVELYRIANAHNLLVVGTTNKTEAYLGYYTKYGDGGVDFEPIGDLYKKEVYTIGEYLELPKEVLTKPPSAGLWKGQTDEEELGYSYDHLDDMVRVLAHRWEGHGEKSSAILGLGEKGITPKDVKYIKDMAIKSTHKKKMPRTFLVRKTRS